MTRGRRRLIAAAGGLCLGGLLAGALLAALTGGAFTVPSSGFNAAGGQASGGGFTVSASVAAPAVTPMSGGNFTVSPGPLAGARPAELGLEAAHAFPTPFRAYGGHDRITFTRLPAKATINVYTLSGELVRSFSKNDGSTDTLVWNPVVNEHGRQLVSGVYLFAISAPGLSPRKGKLMIIR